MTPPLPPSDGATPLPPQVQQSGRNRQRRWMIVAITALVLMSCGGGSLSFAVYAHYEATHNIPNPYWGIFNGSFSYDPAVGPPSPVLMESRPDQIALTYIHDYIKVAGTFPCIAHLNDYTQDYAAAGNDPVLRGNGCAIHRPVAQVRATYVDVHVESLHLAADVYLVVTYTDGERWDMGFAGSLYFVPLKTQTYYLWATHLDCWESSIVDGFYEGVLRRPLPSGAGDLTGSGQAICSPHT